MSVSSNIGRKRSVQEGHSDSHSIVSVMSHDRGIIKAETTL